MLQPWTIPLSVDLATGNRGIPYLLQQILALPGNNGAHVWEITVTRNGQPVDLSDATPTGYITRKGETTPILISGTIVGNVVSYKMTTGCYAIKGETRGTFNLTSPSVGPVPLADVIFPVGNPLGVGVDDPLSLVPNLDQLFAQLGAAQTATAEAIAAGDYATGVGAGLDARMSAAEMMATNLVANGNFANGATGWNPTFATLSAASNTLTITANGGQAYGFATAAIGAKIVGHKYYGRARMRARNAVCTKLQLGVTDMQAEVASPVQDQWYTLSGVATATSTANLVALYEYYADAATANGKTAEVQYVLELDLTTIFGSGYEPTAAQMDAYLARWTNAWFDSTVNISRADKAFPTLLDLKNQIDERTGYGVVTGLGVTAQGTPNMTVAVAAGTCYLPSGRRFIPTAVSALAINAADVTNGRIDIVYVDVQGNVTYLAGTAAASPSARALPTGGLMLAEISVAAGVTSIAAANIQLRRKNLLTEDRIKPTMLTGWVPATGYGDSTVFFYKDASGRVWPHGKPSGGVAGTMAFKVPPGYRPANTVLMQCKSGSNTTGHASINPSGEFYVSVFNAYVVLDGLSWLGEV